CSICRASFRSTAGKATCKLTSTQRTEQQDLVGANRTIDEDVHHLRSVRYQANSDQIYLLLSYHDGLQILRFTADPAPPPSELDALPSVREVFSCTIEGVNSALMIFALPSRPH